MVNEKNITSKEAKEMAEKAFKEFAEHQYKEKIKFVEGLRTVIGECQLERDTVIGLIWMEFFNLLMNTVNWDVLKQELKNNGGKKDGSKQTRK